MPELIGTKPTGECRRLGFLAEPLGWVHARLGKAIDFDPTLIALIFDLDHARMHLIALALAHLPTDVPPDLALILLSGPRNEILNLSLAHRPVGIARALHHLPRRVLPAETYRHLVDLLNHPATGKFLHHADTITEEIITGLHNLPPALRSAGIMALFNRIDGISKFVDGLKVLATRAGLAFDAVATEIGSLAQPDQVAGKIRYLVERLPLPVSLPAADIGMFHRLDTVAEIRDIAKTWHNCLAQYLFNINEGTSAIYPADDLQAVCSVGRSGRLGWFLEQTKGPGNAAIAPAQLARIHADFANAGILRASTIEAIKSILVTMNGHAIARQTIKTIFSKSSLCTLE